GFATTVRHSRVWDEIFAQKEKWIPEAKLCLHKQVRDDEGGSGSPVFTIDTIANGRAYVRSSSLMTSPASAAFIASRRSCSILRRPGGASSCGSAAMTAAWASSK